MSSRYFIDYLVYSDLIFESTAQEAAILTMPEGALTENLLKAKSYGTASPKMQRLGTNMPEADAVESFKMVKSE